MRKVFICGDTHYDLNDGELKRTEDIDRTFNEVITEAIDQGADYFIHLGDAFDNNRPTADSIAKFIRSMNRLEEAEISTYIVVGNHDIIAQAGRTSALEVISAIEYDCIHVMDIPERVDIGNNTDFLFIPHVSKARMVEEGYTEINKFWEETLEVLIEEGQKKIIAFAHHNIEGATAGSESWMIRGADQTIPNSIFENRKLKYLFDGHIHKPQNLKKGKVVIVGSVECLNMGEREESKRYIIMEV